VSPSSGPQPNDASAECVWVFNGAKAKLPAGVFRSREEAEAWIHMRRVSGVLTRYPLGIAVYDWAVLAGVFRPQHPEQEAPRFIQRFCSAALEHHHYGFPESDPVEEP